MFERMMKDMDQRHALRSKLDNADYERELLSSYAEKISSRESAYQRRMSEDPIFAKLFAEKLCGAKKLFSILRYLNNTESPYRRNPVWVIYLR